MIADPSGPSDRSTQPSPDTGDAGFDPFAARPVCPPIRSERARIVAEWFGLTGLTGLTRGRRRRRSRRHASHEPPTHRHSPHAGAPGSLDAVAALVCPGTLTLITGPSGSGKSSLLRRLHDTCVTQGRTGWIDLPRIVLPDVPLTDCFGEELPLTEVLRQLGRVGLGEAWSYLRTPMELSDGQRWRLRLAMGLHLARRQSDRSILVADEFAALLDRVTACVVSLALRRTIDGASDQSLCAVLATSHDDLARALAPDAIVHCDFGHVRVERRASDVARATSP